jgi:type IV pilus assembly protein PilW
MRIGARMTAARRQHESRWCACPIRRLRPGGCARHRLSGMTLVELMVALAMGGFLLIGAVAVFAESRAALRAVDSLARLHENARFALDRLEADIRMAGHWGPAARAHAIEGRAGPLDPVPPALTVRNDCGVNWTIHLDAAVEGGNDGYRWSCAPYGGRASTGGDTLIVRRAGAQAEAALEQGVLYVRSTHLQAGRLLVGGDAQGPLAVGDPAPAHRLLVSGYYVSPTSSLSTAGNPVPSLRVKALRGGAQGPRVVDEEVLPGIEDLQVELGVDTDPPGAPGRGAVSRYVHPEAPLLDPASSAFDSGARVLAVRVWLRARAERPERGYVDTAAYEYADRREPPPLDGFRRLVIGKTIYLRNPGGAP